MVKAMPNFRARKQKSGTTYYYFDTGAKPRKEIPLGSDYRVAVQKWLELSAMPARPVSENFAELADKYEAEVIPLKAKSTQATQLGDLKKLRTFFCNPTPAPLNAIKPKHIYLLLQWAKDTRSLTDHDIIDGYLVIKQSKTSAALRFIIEGELKALLDRIEERKRSHKTWSANLLVSQYGKAMSKQMLRKAFETARSDAADEADKSGNAALAAQIRAFWFYDLRAKAADDVADERGELAASKQLGHTSVQTTKRHYLRRGTRVQATK